jgi:hypothetical protein
MMYLLGIMLIAAGLRRIRCESPCNRMLVGNANNQSFFSFETFHQIFTRRKRNAFITTENEDALMAKAANIGLINMPNAGNKSPAATGTPAAL